MIFPKKYWKAKLMKKNLNNVWDNHSISWRNGPPSQDINVCVNQFYSQWHSPLTLLWIRTEQFVIAGLRSKHCSWPLLGQLCKVKTDVREKFLWLSMKYENLLSITICVTLFKETYKIFLKRFTLSTCLYSKIKKCWYLHPTEPYRQKSLFTHFFFQLFLHLRWLLNQSFQPCRNKAHCLQIHNGTPIPSQECTRGWR